MEPINSISGSVSVDENILELIRHGRNDVIRDFLDERNIRSYYADRYHLNDIDYPKVELIKTELKQLLSQQIDVQHYASLINQMKQAGVPLVQLDINPDLYYKEIQRIFLK